MRHGTVEYRREGHAGIITLNRPHVMNAFTYEMGEDVAAALDETDADGQVRAVIVTGAGKAFCAGRDIADVDPATDDVLGFLGGLVEPVLRRLARFPAPTFAVGHGACLGVGLGLLRLSPDAFWAMTPREFAAAAGLSTGTARETPERGELSRMMAEFPD
jgi:uncharacterized phage protein (TIGR02216 family)